MNFDFDAASDADGFFPTRSGNCIGYKEHKIKAIIIINPIKKENKTDQK